MHRHILLAAAALALSVPGVARAEILKFHTTMSASQEVPPHDVKGSGTVEATLDTATRKLDYTATWQGLTGPATMGHFHGPAAAGANAGVAVPWGSNITSPFKGSATLTDAQIADLEAGKWYANVHTAANPGGEIRGQMTKGQ
jgi:hypothetical protein